MSKTEGLAIYDRLLLLDAELWMVAAALSTQVATVPQVTDGSLHIKLERHFTAITLFPRHGSNALVFGRVGDLPGDSLTEWHRRSGGKTAIWTELQPQHPARVFMIRSLFPSDPNAGFLAAEVNTTFLWSIGAENTLPTTIETCILDQSRNLLASSLSDSENLVVEMLAKMDNPHSGQFSWKNREDEFVSAYWDIFLPSGFFSSHWTVVLSQPRSYVLAPISDFKTIFTLVVLVTFLVILLLSMIHIRRSLIPLNTLKEGTRLIAAGDWTSRVMITSRDEFEHLAVSFNTMTNKIEKQFKTINKITEIDRAILSSLDTGKIIHTVLNATKELLLCDVVVLCMVETRDQNLVRIYVRSNEPEKKDHIIVNNLERTELEKMVGNNEYLFIQMNSDVPPYLEAFTKNGINSFLIMPIYQEEKLLGTLNIGYISADPELNDDIDHARQLGHQIAIAFSNAKLIEELDELNWGTLEALARTVDAKSPWTAGHSQRVTLLALEIARDLGLPQTEIDVLHRAALLHDIGKIGIPATILDKPAELDDEEYRLIREHPNMGARILEPISAYAVILPLVLQHHERFDGQGYPNGLSGDAISLGARILAAADWYDAMVSDRPYRAGWTPQQAAERLREESGRHFDPVVVEAFLGILARSAELSRKTRATLDWPSAAEPENLPDPEESLPLGDRPLKSVSH